MKTNNLLLLALFMLFGHSIINAQEPIAEVVKPDANLVTYYSENLTVFYALLFLTIILLIAIVVLSNSIVTLVKSAYFKEGVSQKNQNKTLLPILIIASLAVTGKSYALDFMGDGEGIGLPWLLVETSDLYALVVIDLILVAVILYIKKLFNQLLKLAEKEVPTEKPITVETFKKINAILTDSVAIEDEHEIMLEHEYDGIRELDNNLPPWWVWGFWFSIFFGIGYLLNYHVFGTSDLQIKAYEKEMAVAQEEIAVYRTKMKMNVDETNATLLTSEADLSSGKSIYSKHCVTCHKTDGEGEVGPNLTDKYWIIGFDIKQVFGKIKKGGNGMPDHQSKLNPIEIQQVASYILSLPYKAGKAPEGKIMEK